MSKSVLFDARVGTKQWDQDNVSVFSIGEMEVDFDASGQIVRVEVEFHPGVADGDHLLGTTLLYFKFDAEEKSIEFADAELWSLEYGRDTLEQPDAYDLTNFQRRAIAVVERASSGAPLYIVEYADDGQVASIDEPPYKVLHRGAPGTKMRPTGKRT
jgi:hypothetical protein